MIEYPDLEPILPIPGATLEAISKKLAISRGTCYKILRCNYSPGAKMKGYICAITKLPNSIWKQEPYLVSTSIYNWFRGAHTDIQGDIDDLL